MPSPTIFWSLHEDCAKLSRLCRWLPYERSWPRPCSISSFEMIQENLKNQGDSVRQGLDTSQTGHVILTGNFWMKILSSYRSSLVLSFKTYNQFCCFCFFISWTPNGSVPQNTCSSGKFFLAWRCGRKDMSLEGECCYEKENSGCLRGFDVYNSCYVLFFISFPHHWRC